MSEEQTTSAEGHQPGAGGTASPPRRDYAAIALKYATDVVSGVIVAGKLAIAACRRQLRDLDRQCTDDFPFRYDAAKGAKVCRFIELMPHIKGKWARQKLKLRLEPWQIFIVMTVFSWVWATAAHADEEVRRKDGNRRFRTSYVEVARKNAKSTVTSGIGNYMLACDGEEGAECYSAATTREQARIVWSDSRQMALRSPAFQEFYGVEVGAHALLVPDTASKFIPLSSDENSLDGLNVHFAAVDEFHAHKTRGVYDVLETATGSREQSLIWIITTSGTNRAGICYEVRVYVVKLLDGSATDETFFGMIYTIDGPEKVPIEAAQVSQRMAELCNAGCTVAAGALQEQHDAHAEACAVRKSIELRADGSALEAMPGDEWSDPAVWIKANPNLGVSVFLDDLQRLCAKALQLPSAQPNFLTKRLNVWVNADSPWMDMRAWDACADPKLKLKDFASEPCRIAADLASKIDIAATVKLFRRDVNGVRHYYVFGRFYVPEDVVEESDNSQYKGWASTGRLIETPGNIIDFDQIEDDLREEKTLYEIKELGYDPFQATQFATGLLSEGFPMVEIGQTVKNLSEPMKEIQALVLSGRLHHDGDPVLSWMVSNVVCHVDAKENVYPRKQLPQNKIDGAVAMMMVFALELKEAEPEPSVYESRGVISG